MAKKATHKKLEEREGELPKHDDDIKGLAQSPGYWEKILDAITSGIWISDKDDTICYCSKGMEVIAGIPSERIIGAAVLSDFPESTLKHFRPHYVTAKQSLKPVPYDAIPVVTPAGRQSYQSGWLIPVVEDGAFAGMICTVEDVTERKKDEEKLKEAHDKLEERVRERTAELTEANARLKSEVEERILAEGALRESEEKYRTLFDAAGDAIFIAKATKEGARIVDCNEHALQMFSYERDELIGKSPWDISPVSQPDGTSSEERGSELIENAMIGQPQFLEWIHRRRDGTLFDAEVTLNGIDVGGEPLLQAIVRDVSERKRAEAERQRLEQQMQHAQKLESLGVLAGGIAHDFNNILMAILGNADLALVDLSEVSPVRAYVKEIEQAARRAADLTRQMLAYSGKGRFVIKAVNPSDIVDEMQHLLRSLISKKTTLRMNLERPLPLIEADVGQIQQIVVNLITNASDAIEESQSDLVVLSTGSEYCSREYLGQSYLDEQRPEGEYVYVEVSDAGCGMDEQTKEKIFDPFFSTKFTGRGLGLAAVLGIVRGHSGAIIVDSELGKGTRVRVLFPALGAETERTSTRVGPETKAEWRGKGTVLLVDDEEPVRQIAGDMLRRAGFDVLTAADGREAVSTFRDRSDEITCVLLDLTMPAMDGEKTLHELRRIKEDVVVVMSSGYSEQEIATRLSGEGLAGFIQKPYQLETLIRKLRAIQERQ